VSETPLHAVPILVEETYFLKVLKQFLGVLGYFCGRKKTNRPTTHDYLQIYSRDGYDLQQPQ
jgi:hypothetical protein